MYVAVQHHEQSNTNHDDMPDAAVRLFPQTGQTSVNLFDQPAVNEEGLTRHSHAFDCMFDDMLTIFFLAVHAGSRPGPCAEWHSGAMHFTSILYEK